MGFAGKDQLDRPHGVVQQPGEPLRVLKQEVRPLITGEAPRKAKGQRVGIEDARGLGNDFGRMTPAGSWRVSRSRTF